MLMMKKIYLFLFAVFVCQIVSAQNNVIEDVSNVINKRGEAKILIPKNEVSNLNILANIISLDYPKGDFWLGYVNNKQYNNFLTLNLKHSLYKETSNDKALNMATTMSQMSNWDRYPTYQVYDSLMRRFASSYPNICRLDTIGFSTNNRLLLCLKISSSPNQDIDKPKFCYSSTMHGDETTGIILLLRLSDWLLSNYGTDTRATNIVNNTQVYINPIANPDGTYSGGNNTVSDATRYNANSVDLNRNYPDPVGGSHTDDEVWQPETLAFMAYADSNDFSLSANLHGGAEVLNYPYDCYPSSTRNHADVDWFEAICKNFIDSIPSSAPSSLFTDVSASGYTDGGDWYTVSGGRQDYHTYFKHSREVTMEVSTDKSLSTSSLNNYWTYLKGGLISYIENCQKGIQGYIRDSSTNEPIKAKVWIENHDAYNSEIYSKSATGYYYRPILNGTYNITYSADGYYSKTISNVTINPNSLINQDILLVRNENGLENISDNNSNNFTIYPNPTKDILIISIPSSFNMEPSTSYTIYNSLGITIEKGYIENNNTNISVKNLNKGIYFVVIGAKVIKFIKE